MSGYGLTHLYLVRTYSACKSTDRTDKSSTDSYYCRKGIRVLLCPRQILNFRQPTNVFAMLC